MTKNIPEVHKKIILEGLKAKKTMDQQETMTTEIQTRVKQEALAAVKDLKEVKYHVKVMKDMASLFIGKD
jgi:hypothetical protein